MFNDLITKINECVHLDFNTASIELVKYIDSVANFKDILKEIGTIPEVIDHDSTHEKLFSKASDAVLARAFREIGLKAIVLRERGDSADVQAESMYHNYTLVADAKAFRLSRTAKNQKDFKVSSLSGWRKDANYAVLCSPLFHYPVAKSQIYAQAVDNNVCLFSWEHMLFLIEGGIKETPEINLSVLWNTSGTYAEHCVVSEKKNCFISEVTKNIMSLNNNEYDFDLFLDECRSNLSVRANYEANFWRNEMNTILSYTKEKAIQELIKAKKIDEKIKQIEKFIR